MYARVADAAREGGKEETGAPPFKADRLSRLDAWGLAFATLYAALVIVLKEAGVSLVAARSALPQRCWRLTRLRPPQTRRVSPLNCAQPCPPEEGDLHEDFRSRT